MAEANENYMWVGSQPITECRGCSELRKEVDDLRGMLISPSVHHRDDDRCCSTYISERKQAEIDKTLLEARRKGETFREDYEKALQEKFELLAENNRLKKELDEKVTEITVLKVQSTTYAADFQKERDDRTRLQSRVIELEEKMAELENDRGRFSTTTRHHNVPIPVHREFVTEPSVYPEHHLPTYSSIYQPVITHHSRRSPRSFERGHDVCDS